MELDPICRISDWVALASAGRGSVRRHGGTWPWLIKRDTDMDGADAWSESRSF